MPKPYHRLCKTPTVVLTDDDVTIVYNPTVVLTDDDVTIVYNPTVVLTDHDLGRV